MKQFTRIWHGGSTEWVNGDCSEIAGVRLNGADQKALRFNRYTSRSTVAIRGGETMGHIEIRVELVREGVYLATCPQVPGLTVECSTRDEAMRMASDIAAELVANERRERLSRRSNLSFRFV